MTEDNKSEVYTNTEEKSDNTGTTPQEKTEITIPVKYNKELKELDIASASVLAQKGLKYDAISEDYEALKRLARLENKSVPQYIAQLKQNRSDKRRAYLTEKCGGDSELAEHIASLEAEKLESANGFEELARLFPEFKTEEELPYEVLLNSNEKGSLLLDEYLRYLLNKQRTENAAALKAKEAVNRSLGSQISRQGSVNPETEEFLKGLWK